MAAIRDYVARLKDGAPGRRFLELHEFRQQDPPTTAVRVGLWAVAILLIGGGIAIGWLPGPGGFVAVFGFAIIGMEFRVVAVTLDRLERFGRDLWARVRGKKK